MTTTAPPSLTHAQPRMHFAPRHNWMNDPNGLVHHDGVHHLYFQYNPQGNAHANLSWGHATSTDLAVWTEHAPAILWDDDAQIFSGSTVVDHGNTSGFGTADAPALVAFYTAAAPGHQAQSIAYSTDGGHSWEKYHGNPVLDRGTSDFRDPKVFRYDDGADGYWVMVAVEAHDRQVLFHRSDDLKTWTFLSAYGPAGPVGGVWECPDMFPLAVDGDEDDVRWVLLISLNPGGIAGGSGTHHVIGDFDGVSFRPTTPYPPATPETLVERSQTREQLEGFGWIDFGRDCYAGVTFDGLARHERTLIAWMDNWEYAGSIPADPEARYRSAMTLPRRLSLVRDGEGVVRLRQTPVATGITEERVVDLGRLERNSSPTQEIPTSGRIRISARLGTSQGLEVRLEGQDGRGGAVLRYDRGAARIELDRSRGVEHLPTAFGGVQTMPVADAEEFRCDVWFDSLNDEVSAVEVFADDGDRVLTSLVPAFSGGVLRISTVGGPVEAVSLGIAEAR